MSGTPEAFPRDDPGQAPEELAALRRWQDGYEAAYRGYGAVIIDAARPLGDVVDEILAASLLC